MSVESILTQQRHLNREAFDNWERCADHRAMVTDLLLPNTMANRVTLAGIGNGCDVDFAVLSRHYSAMTLVDIDHEAVQSALLRQHKLNSECSVDVVTCDLTNGSWLNSEPSDVTASLCMFSQLVEQLPHTESIKPKVVAALRRTHLQMLLNNTVPGGRIVFFSDIVSAFTAPEIHSLEGAGLARRVGELVAEGNFFTGTNPHQTVSYLKGHERVRSIEVRDPWLWHFGKRCFAVYAVVAQL